MKDGGYQNGLVGISLETISHILWNITKSQDERETLRGSKPGLVNQREKDKSRNFYCDIAKSNCVEEVAREAQSPSCDFNLQIIWDLRT